MQTIELRRRSGAYAGTVKLDDEDHAVLGALPWCLAANGYAVRRSADGRISRMHREIMGLEIGNPLQVDHVNHDILDNRRANLRVVTPRENAQNLRPRGGASRHRGVTLEKKSGLWVARCTVDGVTYYLGRHRSEDDAARAAAAGRAERMTHA